MVRDHFPMNHTDDPLADGLQPRFTTVHHDLQPFTTVYNRSLRFTIWTAKQNKAKLSNKLTAKMQQSIRPQLNYNRPLVIAG